MIALLSWRVWAGLALAIGLAFSHFTAYRSGKASVRAEWTAEKLAQSEAARNREKAMTIACSRISDYKKTPVYFCGICWKLIKGDKR